MGRDLARVEAVDTAIPVNIEAAGGTAREASGLSFMLQQFFEQTLEDSPEKRRLARRLRGAAVFCAAEDEAIQVCIRFCGDRIELSDTDEREAAPMASVTASITARST